MFLFSQHTMKKFFLNFLSFFDKTLRRIAIIIIKIWQKLFSPMYKTCRFYPSCSEYSKRAFLKYNFFKATILSIYRILRCNPFNPGGYDPLP